MAKKTQKKVVKKATPVAKKKVGNTVVKSISPKPAANRTGVQPLGDRVLVRPLSADDTRSPSGIIIPDTAKQEKPERGTVVAVGEGRRAESGEMIPPRVAVGDTVMFSKYGFDEITVNDVDYVIVSEGSILAIINK